MHLRNEPELNIAPDALKAWRITALITNGVFWILVIVLGILTFTFNFSKWYLIGSALFFLITTIVFVWIVPTIRFKRWRYEIFDQEIYIQHGIIIVTRTLVPMTRVQHVDTVQGPVLKKFGLASVTISTAATVHEIPALLEEDAGELRDQLSQLARVAIDDV